MNDYVVYYLVVWVIFAVRGIIAYRKKPVNLSVIKVKDAFGDKSPYFLLIAGGCLWPVIVLVKVVKWMLVMDKDGE